MADHAAAPPDESPRRHGPHDSALDDSNNNVAAKDGILRLRIRELEESNEFLADKAAAASQRFADYENNIRVLELRLKEQQERHHAQRQHVHANPEPPPTPPGLSRFGSFMRKPSVITSSPSARESELEAALAKEQTLRIEAEKKTREVTAEIEDLSTTLFQQANDMVATERRENAALRGRIEDMERVVSRTPTPVENGEVERLKGRVKMLEQRDKERLRRLEKLEAAQRRIERVRGMLAPG